MVTNHQLKVFLKAGGSNMDPFTCNIESLTILTGLSERKILDVRENSKQYAGGYLVEVNQRIADAEESVIAQDDPYMTGLLDDKKLLEKHAK